jgi:hypothetical protein
VSEKVSALTTLIANRALCRDCIAEKAAITPDSVERIIADLSRAVKVDHYANGLCVDCRRSRLVYAIDRPPAA